MSFAPLPGTSLSIVWHGGGGGGGGGGEGASEQAREMGGERGEGVRERETTWIEKERTWML